MGQDAVGVHEDEEVAAGAVHAVVAGNASSLVILEEVLDAKAVGVLAADVAAGHGTAVFHYHDLEIAVILRREAFQ